MNKLALMVKSDKDLDLYFNYWSEYNEFWNNDVYIDEYNHKYNFPAEEEHGCLGIEL